jgi:hypothetical protein
LKEGFACHGVDAEITADKHRAGGIHVVQGPHYAFAEWLGKENVIWLDRCLYGDSRFDLSIGWLQPDGSRWFKNEGKTEANGTLPELKPLKTDQKGAVIFADYGKMVQAKHWTVDAREDHFPVYMRPHPAEMQSFYSLDDMWERCGVAIGGQSTVLVQAAINGLHVVSHDPLHVCQDIGADREAWLTRLSWCQWHYTEIQNGAFWEHLA